MSRNKKSNYSDLISSEWLNKLVSGKMSKQEYEEELYPRDIQIHSEGWLDEYGDPKKPNLHGEPSPIVPLLKLSLNITNQIQHLQGQLGHSKQPHQQSQSKRSSSDSQ